MQIDTCISPSKFLPIIHTGTSPFPFDIRDYSYDNLKNIYEYAYRTLIPQISIFPMYGLTECKRVSILTPEEYESHRDSVGKPISCCKVKVVDNNGNEVKHGMAGELVVTGANVMKGYYKDEKLTCEKFIVNKEGIVELHTGDIFTMDEDGFLYFVSRTQNFLKIREKRVSPLTIEREIMNNSEGIMECLIVPLREPSMHDAVFCFLRLDNGYSVDDMINSITKRISRSYIPNYFCNFKHMFFHNLNGKIDRKKMAALAKELFDSGEYIKYKY